MLPFLAQQTWYGPIISHELFIPVALITLVFLIAFVITLVISSGNQRLKSQRLESRIAILEAALPSAQRLTGVTTTLNVFQEKATLLEKWLNQLMATQTNSQEDANNLHQEIQGLITLAKEVLKQKEAFDQLLLQLPNLQTLISQLESSVERSTNKWNRAAKDLQKKEIKLGKLLTTAERLHSRNAAHEESMKKLIREGRDITAAAKTIKKNQKQLDASHQKADELEQKYLALSETADEDILAQIRSVDKKADVGVRHAAVIAQAIIKLYGEYSNPSHQYATLTAERCFSLLMYELGIQHSDSRTMTPPQLSTYQSGGAQLPQGAGEVQSMVNGQNPFDPKLAAQMEESLEILPDQSGEFFFNEQSDPFGLTITPPTPAPKFSPRPPSPPNKRPDAS